MNKLFTAILLILLIVFSACGKTGKEGATGVSGSKGSTGATGPTGADGSPAVNVTPIQLCSNFTSSYPNTFPEYAICLSGTLYGVYSANGGFLALLPPGTYTSDGIGASCTFKVDINCAVEEL